jgi:hypothetical protein
MKAFQIDTKIPSFVVVIIFIYFFVSVGKIANMYYIYFAKAASIEQIFQML